MSDSTQPAITVPDGDSTPEQDVAAKAAAAWLNQFARTLKTCRLYDQNNPTVVRFREDLVTALTRVLAEHGSLRYRFTSEDVLYGDVSLYPARSRDDNFALPFYQDGVRAITFMSGIHARELGAVIDAILAVTGQNETDNDLVTMLWEANLAHVDVDYVPPESDVGSGAGAESGELVLWPTAAAEEAQAEAEAAHDEENAEPATGRSDDWTVGDETVEIEAGFEELEALSGSEVQRFRQEYEAEHAVSVVTSTLAITNAVLSSELTDEDRAEIAEFLPRVLRQAVAHSSWLEAREAIYMLKQCSGPGWSIERFAQELQQPISVSTIVERIDQLDAPAVVDMIGFARTIGDPAIDWLMLLLAESQSRRNRRMLAEAIAELCKGRPDLLAHHMTDPRWFVVRNTVHILGWIGGNDIVKYLDIALRHSDLRVRQEAVAALAQVESRLARPLLLRLLDTPDPKLFSMVLHQLSTERDASTARLLLTMLQDPAFEQRTPEARRAVYSALSSVGGDEVLPELEAELHRTSWFSKAQEAHRQSIARIIARIGTPLARTILETGAQSRRGPVKKACQDVMGGISIRE